MNSKILLALFVVVGLVAVSFAQDVQQEDSKPSALEIIEDRPERDASLETDEHESPRVKRQWGYGGYGGGYGYPRYGYGYGYRPYRPWGYRRFGYGGYYG
uniref:Uncharacterized protein n=1 Tax=Panagrolaimus sp. ES5 TaxID=591445 RepID=A0AC34G7T7_9BILA